MPKGKYPRPNAAAKAARAKPAEAVAPAAVVLPPVIEPVIEPQVPEPDPLLVAEALALAEATAKVQQATATAATYIARARVPNRWADHPKSRDIDSLEGDELRTYATAIGMTRRDVAELGDDRLRAGCKAHLQHTMFSLLDD